MRKGVLTFVPTAMRKPVMPRHAPKPTVATLLPMCFMVSWIASAGTTWCVQHEASDFELATCPLHLKQKCQHARHNSVFAPTQPLLSTQLCSPRRRSS